MNIFNTILVFLLLCHPVWAVEYNKYPTREDTWREIPWGDGRSPLCRGKIERMPNCIVDGDTVRIQYRLYRIGNLDTPETRRPSVECPDKEKALGNRAKEITVDLLTNAKDVKVTVFINPLTKDEVRDKYGRILVNIAADGKDIAQALIQQGLAREYQGGKKISWCG